MRIRRPGWHCPAPVRTVALPQTLRPVRHPARMRGPSKVSLKNHFWCRTWRISTAHQAIGLNTWHCSHAHKALCSPHAAALAFSCPNHLTLPIMTTSTGEGPHHTCSCRMTTIQPLLGSYTAACMTSLDCEPKDVLAFATYAAQQLHSTRSESGSRLDTQRHLLDGSELSTPTGAAAGMSGTECVCN